MKIVCLEERSPNLISKLYLFPKKSNNCFLFFKVTFVCPPISLRPSPAGRTQRSVAGDILAWHGRQFVSLTSKRHSRFVTAGEVFYRSKVHIIKVSVMRHLHVPIQNGALGR